MREISCILRHGILRCGAETEPVYSRQSVQFASGTSLTRYLITAPLGKGGMGEVYRARDTSLGREVAIKILPAALAGDPERLARFQREAQVLAAISHRGIAAIHGLEQADGVPFLIMELVEGEDLATRLARGAMPIDEALDVARQLAEALEAAHEKGIVHRDLKPANVMLTQEGGVKVLDFGLAKALSEDGVQASAELTNSPTVARATSAGVILGTAAYMSPEQARGKPVDKRSDIWSFGVVLFEMLTGKQPFHGETVSDILAAVLRQEIDWSALPGETPANAATLLRRCLMQNAADRLRDIGEARVALSGAGPSVAPAVAHPRSPLARIALLSILLAAIALTAAATWLLKPEPPRRAVRASIEMPAGLALGVGVNAPPNVALSADGSTIAFTAAPIGQHFSLGQLYIRPLAAPQATLVPGSRGARAPFFSPDGAWVAFVAGNELKKVPVTGGSPTVLVPEVPNAWGGTWLEGGTIIYSNFLATGEALFAVGEDGGPPRVVRRMKKLNEDYSFPFALGDGELLVSRWLGGSYADARIDRVGLHDGSERSLLAGGSNARVLDAGVLVYARAGELFAVPFDGRRRLLTGTPVPVLSGVFAEPRYQAPQFDVSPEGTLVYAAGAGIPEMSLQWIDRTGHSEMIAAAPYIDAPRMSRDGRSIVYVSGQGNADIWRIELASRRHLRLTTASGEDYAPEPTPDDGAVVFVAWREATEIRRVTMSGGSEERVMSLKAGIDSISFSADGRWMAVDGDPKASVDIGVVDMRANRREVRWIVESSFEEAAPRFAPRGERLAYVSDQSGRAEVWVRASVENGEARVVSRDGGSSPFWSPDGRTLYFTTGTKLFAADVNSDGPLELSEPSLVMETGDATVVGMGHDGRFLAHLRAVPRITRLEIILNWDREVEARLARSR